MFFFPQKEMEFNGLERDILFFYIFNTVESEAFFSN